MYPSFKNLLSSSQALRQCYFHLLLKRCRSVWEFDNKILSDGHTVVKRTFRGIWRIITFNVIITITNAISKHLPSSGTKWPPVFLHYDVHWPPEYIVNDFYIIPNDLILINNFWPCSQNFIYKLFIWICCTTITFCFTFWTHDKRKWCYIKCVWYPTFSPKFDPKIRKSTWKGCINALFDS